MISVCIPTYRRPDQLRGLLNALLADKERPQPIEIVVCDNDAARTAELVVQTEGVGSDVEIRYFCEPRQNISLARNILVAEARGEWVAFIDDDELPCKNWLSSLLATVETYKADGAFGPVVPVLPGDVDAWPRAIGFFEPKVMKTGTRLAMRDMACGNAMVRRDMLRKVSGPFDPAFGLSGGEDTMLFGTLLLVHGGVFVWCAEASATEPVAQARCNRDWVLRRSFRSGQAYALIERQLFGAVRGISRSFWAIIATILLMASLPFVFVAGAIRFDRQLVKLAAKVGQISAVFPWRYREYG
jgi:succinoglycan biosynthesis protein ExoM